MGLWARIVLPVLVEKACRSGAILAARRQWVPRAHGRVLEVGVGSGLNLAFYDPQRVECVTGIDPSVELLVRAEERAVAAPVSVELVRCGAEKMPFSDGAFDSVLVTYSLCSVADLAAALAEIRRVLQPGGELIFVEHGLSCDPRVQRWQRWLTPAWRRVGGGCHLDRDLPTLLRSAGYRMKELESAQVEGASWLSYTFMGIAR